MRRKELEGGVLTTRLPGKFLGFFVFIGPTFLIQTNKNRVFEPEVANTLPSLYSRNNTFHEEGKLVDSAYFSR